MHEFHLVSWYKHTLRLAYCTYMHVYNQKTHLMRLMMNLIIIISELSDCTHTYSQTWKSYYSPKSTLSNAIIIIVIGHTGFCLGLHGMSAKREDVTVELKLFLAFCESCLGEKLIHDLIIVLHAIKVYLATICTCLI